MESTVPNINSLLDTTLTTRVYQASRSIPRKVQWRLFLLALILSDAIMASIAFRVAYIVRFDLSIPLFKQDAMPSLTTYQTLVFILIPVWLGIFAVAGLYNRHNLLGGTREYSLVFNSTTIGMFTVISAGFLVPEFIFARGWLLLAWAFVFLFTSIGRFVLRRIVYSLREHGYYLSPAIIIGANEEGVSLAEQLISWKSSGLHVLGFVDAKEVPGTRIYRHLHSLGKVDQLDTIIKQYGIEEVILATSAFSSRDNMLDIFKTYGVASGVSVRMSSGLYEIITTGLTVKEFAFVPLVGVNQLRLTGFDKFMKLALDYAIAIPGVIAVAPIMLIIGLLVKLDSPGPALHRRRVLGVNGKQFDAFKFRTMHVNGDEILAKSPELVKELKENGKLKDDPRVTKIGQWLRKVSLDELPQLFNVLRGEMSLVGPRMITEEELDKYDQWDINLLTVRPGLTGLWQVSGRSDVSYEQRVRYDMYYIRNWSIWLDLQLLFQTLPAVIKRRGAY
jgi:exopolysaccharide biosynthesis polyprenyl glycosylphosphotransferase